jgi:LemA protein
MMRPLEGGLVAGIVPFVLPVCATALALFFFWALGCYNRLQGLRNAAWQDLQRCLQAWQERNVATSSVLHLIDAYVQHERATLAVVDAALQAQTQACATVRNSGLQASGLDALAVREGQLAQQTEQLRALCAEYADLKINPQLLGLWALQSAQADTCSFLLRAYNEAAEKFNAAAAATPAQWVARSMQLRACTVIAPPAVLPVPAPTSASQMQLL